VGGADDLICVDLGSDEQVVLRAASANDAHELRRSHRIIDHLGVAAFARRGAEVDGMYADIAVGKMSVCRSHFFRIG
jgi:hypothetical protein